MTTPHDPPDIDAVYEIYENELEIAHYALDNTVVLAAKVVAMLLRDLHPTAVYMDLQTTQDPARAADVGALLGAGASPTDRPTLIDFDEDDTEDPLHELLAYYFNTGHLLQLARRDPDRFQGPPIVTPHGDRDSGRYRMDLVAAAELPIPAQPLMAPVVLRHAVEAVDDFAGTDVEIDTLRTALTLAMQRWPEVKAQPRR